MMRAMLAGVLALSLAACGGSSPSPTAPTTPVSREWTLAGQVVTTLTGDPVAGATVMLGDLSATADGAGRFEFRAAAAPAAPFPVSVRAAGYIDRRTHVSYPRTTPLSIDLVADRAPFDLGFYRALVRNGFESPGALGPTYRWTRDTRFHLQTVDSAGRSVEPEVLELLRRELPRAFAAWTSGRYRATVEESPDDPQNEAGLVRVLFMRSAEDSCARATVGGNWGWMTFNIDRCGCGSTKVTPNVVWHEVGHTAGFWHVDGRYMMDPWYTGDCGSAIQITQTELHHARIAYERPWGNVDPDQDPDWFLLLDPGMAERPTVTCP